MTEQIKGLSKDNLKKFHKLIAQGIPTETAGGQVGLGPNEAKFVARQDARAIRVVKKRLLNAKPKAVTDTKTRRCLIGGHDFISESAGERICSDCKKTPAWRDGDTTYSIAL